MDNNGLTVLLVSSKGKGAKSYSINYKYITVVGALIASFIIIALISFFFSFNYYKKAQTYASDKKETLDILVNQANLLNVMSSDKMVLQSRLSEIESKLQEMQTILDKKGIDKDLSVGGEYIPNEKWSLSYMDFMEKDIDDLFSIMQNTPFGKPIQGTINSGYGYRRDPFTSKNAFHSGIDFEANQKQTVVATALGIVEHAGWYKSYGKTVIIKHENGYKTLYGHLSNMKVKKGDKVSTGQPIGLAGSTGRSTGPHLHYEILKNDKTINPREYLTFK